MNDQSLTGVPDRNDTIAKGFAIPNVSDDKPVHECGIFGIVAADADVARLTFFGLYALQHRGQESAGIAVSNGRSIRYYKNMGLVAQVFDEEKLRPLSGYMAIGHTRYSTTGSSNLKTRNPSWSRAH
jgi:Glutamine phosphoribosylpyrophosphate amidotransferase